MFGRRKRVFLKSTLRRGWGMGSFVEIAAGGSEAP
jgi:hypothetical protein